MTKKLNKIVQKAAKEIKDLSDLKVAAKEGHGNFVTTADTKSEEIIIKGLKAEFPDCQILTEETKSKITKDNFRDAKLLFVIDPLDGTSSFLFDIPHTAISIGAYESGEPKCGVVYDIFKDNVYEVEIGKGLFLNGKKVVKKEAPPLGDAMIGSSWAYGETPGVLVEKWKKLVGKVAMLRVMGSGVLDLIMTASGQFTCYVHNSLTPYDCGAGFIALKEMGIKTTNWEGREFTIFDKDIIAAPPEIFDDFYNLVFKQ